MAGSLSNKNEALAREHLAKLRRLITEAGYDITASDMGDAGGRLLLMVRNPDAVTYTQAQVASGEAHELEATR